MGQGKSYFCLHLGPQGSDFQYAAEVFGPVASGARLARDPGVQDPKGPKDLIIRYLGLR